MMAWSLGAGFYSKQGQYRLVPSPRISCIESTEISVFLGVATILPHDSPGSSADLPAPLPTCGVEFKLFPK